MTTVPLPVKHAASDSLGVPPVTDRGIGRAFVRMLSAAVESGDFAEALKVVRGAEVHYEFLTAHPEKVVR
jgi:hypothetical protein